MYNFKPILENRRLIKKNKQDLDTVEKMMGLERLPEGEFKRKGAIPADLAGPDAPVEYEMDGLVAKLKVEEPAP
tara:strand:- start:41762 stop:41983 length:222 start_codon:yes stop_codon:yes gene_type:complete